MNHYTFIGATRSGKTWAVIFYLMSLDIPFLYVDPQPNGGGKDVVAACKAIGKPIIEENVDTDVFLPCDFGTPSGNADEDAKNVESLLQPLFSARDQGAVASYVQTEEHATAAVYVKMYSNLPWHQLKGMWFSDTNARIIERVNHQPSLLWLLNRPSSRSAAAREMYPAIRLLSVLTDDPAMIKRDLGKSVTVNALNEGVSISVYGGNRATVKGLKGVCNLRVAEVVRAAQQGRLKGPVAIVIEEAELLGVSEATAQIAQAQGKNNISLIVICQEPRFGDQTEVIMQNTNHFWMRSGAHTVLKQMVDDLPGLYQADKIKNTRTVLRQIIEGYETYDTVSETEGPQGTSITTGTSERPIRRTYEEEIHEYMKQGEQELELMKEVAKFKPGQGILNQHGDISFWQVPNLATWIGEQRKNLKIVEVKQWLIEDKSSSNSDSTHSPMSKQQDSSMNMSDTTKTQERPSSETSGHWSKVKISTLSGWLWPENEESNSMEK